MDHLAFFWGGAAIVQIVCRKIHDIQIPQKNEFYTYMYNCIMYVFEFCLIKGALAMIWNDVHWWVESDRRDQHRESTKDLESHLVISRSRSLPFMRIICANVITIIVHCCVLPWFLTKLSTKCRNRIRLLHKTLQHTTPNLAVVVWTMGQH